ncbi:MAG: hypothetical protein ACRDYY_16980 [Acidimicrobiales bacterium]
MSVNRLTHPSHGIGRVQTVTNVGVVQDQFHHDSVAQITSS